MAKVKKITASEVILGQGKPGIKTCLEMDNNVKVYMTPPYEEKKFSYQVENFEDANRSCYFINNLIGPKLVGVDVAKQAEVDGWLIGADGTNNKSKLGANTMLAVSTIFSKAAATESGVKLFQHLNNIYNSKFAKISLEKIPNPIMTVLENKSNPNLDFHGFEIIATSTFSFTKSVKMGVDVRTTLKNKFNTTEISNNFEAIKAVEESTAAAGYKLGKDAFLGINFAADQFGKNSIYHIRDRAENLKIDDYLKFLTKVDEESHPLIFMDPLSSFDWQSWKSLNNNFFKESYLVAADIIASSPDRLKKAVVDKICSSFVIKLGQTATLSEVFAMVEFAKKNGLSYIFSHSTFESNDSYLADLSVALQSDYVMFGRPVHGENLSKYNRMLEIEEEISNDKSQIAKPNLKNSKL